MGLSKGLIEIERATIFSFYTVCIPFNWLDLWLSTWIAGDPSQEDMDVIFILTRDSYYVANYDDDVDKVTRYQCVSYFDIESIEFGTLEESALSQLGFR